MFRGVTKLGKIPGSVNKQAGGFAVDMMKTPGCIAASIRTVMRAGGKISAGYAPISRTAQMRRSVRLPVRSFSAARGSEPVWKHYHVTSTGTACQSATTTDDGFTIATDIPANQGGKNTAAQPVFLLLSALVGCEQATSTFVAKHMKIGRAIDRVDFDVHAKRDQRGAIGLPIESNPDVPSRLDRVWGTATVHTKPGAAVSSEQVAALGERVHHRCPVAQMMTLSGCAVDIDWILAAPPSPDRSAKKQ